MYASYTRVGRTSYDRISGPMEALGREVLARLELRGDEIVLTPAAARAHHRGADRACPAWAGDRGGRIALDGAGGRAVQRSARPARQVEVRLATCSSSSCREPVDAVFRPRPSTGSPITIALFASPARGPSARGRLVAQCGGEGNIDVLRGRANMVVAREPYARALLRLAPAVELRRARTRPASACSPPASSRPSAGCSPRPSSPSTRASSSPRSSSVHTCSSCPRICVSRSWTTCWRSWVSPWWSTTCA